MSQLHCVLKLDYLPALPSLRHGVVRLAASEEDVAARAEDVEADDLAWAGTASNVCNCLIIHHRLAS